MMKNKHTFARVALTALLLPLLSEVGSAVAKPALTAGANAAKGSPRRVSLVKHAEEILGRPLTPAQKTALRAAQKQRVEAMKPIQEKFRVNVAKALGLTVAQYAERARTLRAKKKQG